MNSAGSGRQAGAFTLVEMLVVMAIIGILAALLLPAVERSKARALRIQCVGNLREIGIATHVFANDHNGRFPTMVSTNDGGAIEFVKAGFQLQKSGVCFYFSHKLFRPLAGALSTPKVLVCPADWMRWSATNFDQFDNRNLSYDIGIVADPNNPSAILAVDDEIPCNHVFNGCTIIRIPQTKGLPPIWGGPHNAVNQRRNGVGNILFTDGHVEESDNARVLAQEAVAEDLFRPSLLPANGYSPPGGPGEPPPQKNPIIPKAKTDDTPSSPIVGRQGFSNQPSTANAASPTPNSSTGFNQPARRVVRKSAFPQEIFANSPVSGVNASNQVLLERTAVASNEVSAITNAAATNVSELTEDNSTGSQFNRRAASVLRFILFGAYFLFLLLFLLYVAYRTWRRWQLRKRKHAQAIPKE